MYGAHGLTLETPTFAELSFRSLDGWTSFFGDAVSVNFVTVGDDLTGPALSLVAYAPGEFPSSPAHSHASDSLRLCFDGEYGVGRTTYGPGGFRFQKGWVPYTGERFGTDGCWVLIMGGDRRGSRARPVDEELATSELEMMVRQGTKELVTSFGITVDDWLSDDPADTAGPSALVATMGVPTPSGKIDGTLGDPGWEPVGPGTRAAIALLGEPERGPVVVLSTTEADQRAMARCRFGTEVVRMVVRGRCTIGDREYGPGDLRIQRAETWCDEAVAGPEGLDEVLVIADRRHAAPSVDAIDAGAWPTALGEVADSLLVRLGEC